MHAPLYLLHFQQAQMDSINEASSISALGKFEISAGKLLKWMLDI